MGLRRCFSGRNMTLVILLILLHVLTLALLILKLVKEQWSQAGLCLLCLALYSLPSLLGLIFRASIPPLLYGIVACFAAAANLGGEVFGLYLRIPFWDSGLHFLWGILAAVIGYSMPDLLGRQAGLSRSMPKAAAALLSVSFAMLIAVLWEFVEFAVDLFFNTDMQKDTWIGSVYSVLLQPDGLNRAWGGEISSIVVNGELWPAYLDVGLHDTVHDLFWTFIGAIPGTVLVLSDYRKKGPSRLLTGLKPEPNQTAKDGTRKP